MKKRKDPRSTGIVVPSVTTQTGHHCPVNGFWLPEDEGADPMFIFEGSLMPTSEGRSTVWHLVNPLARSGSWRPASAFAQG